MNNANKKIVIGLTGNVATGKSVVRLMLEHLGAYSIDADKLAHKIYKKQAPAFAPVVKHFGQWIVGSDGEINRKKLGQIVFNDPKALKTLESIVHPYIHQATKYLINKSDRKVIVIEAIKILDGPLHDMCDAIWVTSTTRENQFSRLIKNRHLLPANAQARIDIQDPAIYKLQKADHIIDTNGSIEKTWQQVQAGWDKFVGEDLSSVQEVINTSTKPQTKKHHLKLHRAKPTHAQEIADFINQHSPNEQLSAADVMISFGEKAYFLIKEEEQTLGIAGWQVENLVVKIDTVIFPDEAIAEIGLSKIINEIEKLAIELNAEVSVIALPENNNLNSQIKTLEYDETPFEEIRIKAWKDVISATDSVKEIIWLKTLRKERILRPF